MRRQAFLGAEQSHPCDCIMVEHLREGLDDHRTLIRKHLCKLRELAPSMGETVTADACPCFPCVGCEGVGHHQRFGALRFTKRSQRLQMLSGMGAPGRCSPECAGTMDTQRSHAYGVPAPLSLHLPLAVA